MPTSRQLPTGRRLPRFERVVLRLARFIRRTARVHPLELGDFLVVNRDGRAAVALFTDEVVTGGGDVTAQARHALEIDHLVPAGLDPRGRRRRVGRKGGGQLQREELPPVGRGKRCLGMLHHGLTRHQLQKGPDGVLGVRDPVAQDAHGFGQSLGVCVPDVGVPDFRTITDAAERLVSDRDILLRLDQPGHDAEHGDRECDAAHPSLFHSLTPLKSPNGWLARSAIVSMWRALILDSSVWRGMPSFAAAPEGPEIRPRDSASAAMIKALSPSASVVTWRPVPIGAWLGSPLSHDSSMAKVSPSHRITARSITFCSSRTFPGQSYACSSSNVCFLIVRMLFPACLA